MAIVVGLVGGFGRKQEKARSGYAGGSGAGGTTKNKTHQREAMCPNLCTLGPQQTLNTTGENRGSRPPRCSPSLDATPQVDRLETLQHSLDIPWDLWRTRQCQYI